MTHPSAPLTTEEAARLAELEPVIERGLRSFMGVGAALVEIGRDKLYRATHETFEAYCEGRWGFSKVHAYRLIGAVRVVEKLPVGYSELITNEAQARELAELKEPEMQVRVLRKLQVLQKPITAEAIKEEANYERYADQQKQDERLQISPSQRRNLNRAIKHLDSARRELTSAVHMPGGGRFDFNPVVERLVEIYNELLRVGEAAA